MCIPVCAGVVYVVYVWYVSWCGWDVGVCMCVGGCECVGPICGVRVGVYVVEDLKLTFYPLVRMIVSGSAGGAGDLFYYGPPQIPLFRNRKLISFSESLTL